MLCSHKCSLPITPIPSRLRFKNRPGREIHESWIDLHLRESVIANEGAKTWEDLGIEKADLSKVVEFPMRDVFAIAHSRSSPGIDTCFQ